MRTFLSVFALAATPALASAAAGTPTTFCALVTFVVNIVNTFTAFMVLAALVAYLYGISTNISQAGESNKSRLKNIILWGIIGLFVMVSIWGILHILQSALFSTDTVTGRSC